MIFGHIDSNNTLTLPDAIEKGLNFLRNTDFNQCETGKIAIDGDNIFAEVIETITGKVSKAKPEIHAKYIDIHYLISGKEYIGVVPDIKTNTVFESKMPKHDILFYESVENETFLEMFPGSYAIFFPEDVHRPCRCKDVETPIRKVVVKIAVSTLK